MPISSSTSYYTNSPSPPHAGEPPPPQDEPLVDATTALGVAMVATNLAQCFPHSTQAAVDTAAATTQQHSDNLVISRNQFENMSSKLDQLTRRVQQLEQTLQTDVRMILTMLQQQQGKEVSLVKSEVRFRYLKVIYEHSKPENI